MSFLYQKELVAVLVFTSLIFALTKIRQTSNPAYETGCNLWDKKEKSEICFELINRLKNKTALYYFAELYRNDKDFRIGECHIYAHSLGRAAYHEKRPEVLEVDNFSEIPKEAALCAVKIYHGYFQDFFANPPPKEKTLAEAIKICDKTASNNGPTDSLRHETTYHCYHGIGYGIAVNYAEKYGEQEKEILRAAVSDCQKANKNKDDWAFQSCLAGIYEAFTWSYLGEVSENLKFSRPADPYKLCRGETDPTIQESCLIGLRSFVWSTTLDLKKNLDLLQGFREDLVKSAAEDVILGAISFFIKEKNETNAELLGECRKLENKFQETCIGAVGYRLAMFVGLPPAIDFCNQAGILEGEKSRCFDEILDSLQKNFSESERQNLCPDFNEPNRSLCYGL